MNPKISINLLTNLLFLNINTFNLSNTYIFDKFCEITDRLILKKNKEKVSLLHSYTNCQ